ncbi:MAG TPA: PDZ domain-containing protein, partial [Usitatibacter sp.]|nr:PDZ domain-containing protein [Usitatibacter sp.]
AAPPFRVAASEAQSDVDLAAIGRLFGAAPPSSGPAAARGGLRLKGVIAPTPGVAASAIFSTGTGRDIAVFMGREVQPGVKLSEVHPTYVVLSRSGVDERIDLEAWHGAAAAARPGARTTGFHLNVARSGATTYSLSRKELDDALRDPNQLNYLGTIGIPPGGGVRMESAPAGSLAAKLGLQPGDVIRSINGQPVASPGDLARLWQQFATTSLVQADVQRGTSTVHLSYQIQ